MKPRTTRARCALDQFARPDPRSSVLLGLVTRLHVDLEDEVHVVSPLALMLLDRALVSARLARPLSYHEPGERHGSGSIEDLVPQPLQQVQDISFCGDAVFNDLWRHASCKRFPPVVRDSRLAVPAVQFG